MSSEISIADSRFLILDARLSSRPSAASEDLAMKALRHEEYEQSSIVICQSSMLMGSFSRHCFAFCDLFQAS